MNFIKIYFLFNHEMTQIFLITLPFSRFPLYFIIILFNLIFLQNILNYQFFLFDILKILVPSQTNLASLNIGV